jgi:hypothetical protein
MNVRLGSTSAIAFVTSGSSAPGPSLVTSISPLMKCDWYSTRVITLFT